jgi:hypothetical protein
MNDDSIERLLIPVDDPPRPDRVASPPPARGDEDGPIRPEPRGLSAAEYAVAGGPRQLAVGFGIVAAIILLLIGRRARRRKG